MRPAWSEQFKSDVLQRVAPMRLPTPLTKEWAWGDADGEGVNVAVVDSGVDGDHPAVGGIAGGVGFEYDAEVEGLVQTLDEHHDLFGHGTACSGVIKKVAPKANIYSVRVLGRNLTGKGVVFARGLRWCIENGMHVVNLSLSTTKRDFFDLFHELADQAYFKHMMLVSAINNIKAPSYPSEYSSVFSVAAHDGHDPFSIFYNPFPPVEFGAPGIDVEVAWANHSYIKATGNSFAAPNVAGLIARILSKHPGLTPFQMKTILYSVSDNAEAA